MDATKTLSPMMAQWQECKNRAPSALLLFRLGDFYELFGEDAQLVSRLLELTLTERQGVPMCGVPAHAADGYIDRLVGRGYRVAIAEQVEDPKLTKGLVRREIVRILSPGNLIDSSLLKEKCNNFLLSLCQLGSWFGLAWADLSTGEFRILEVEGLEEVADELLKIRPSELVVSRRCWERIEPFVSMQLACPVVQQEEWRFGHAEALAALLKQFQVQTLDGFGLKGVVAGVNAAGALITYLKEELAESASHLSAPLLERSSSYMTIDRSTERHLELLEGEESSLVQLLDQTVTPMGGRLLRQWILRPLLDLEAIVQRQDGIAAFLGARAASKELLPLLRAIRDLERMISRVESGRALPRDLLGIALSLSQLPKIKERLSAEPFAALRYCSSLPLGACPLAEELLRAIVESPPLRLTEGGIFRDGYDKQLDDLRAMEQRGQDWLERYQEHLRIETGIRSLKVGFTRAAGYYIEVSRSQVEKIPSGVLRRQSLTSGERFVTSELKTWEEKISKAESMVADREYQLFMQLREQLASHAREIRLVAAELAQIDLLLGLARLAEERSYVRPVLLDGDLLEIEEGRHPVLEKILGAHQFVPNSLHIGSDHSRLHLITGPNMAGKSTFLRQTALLVVMAQMGSFLPATSARMGLVDRLLSRIGAQDDLTRGQSTFMVEMAETAHILRSATRRSLVILDEIGRGTSTYDGIAIASAVAEHLLNEAGPKTLFATHYAELTSLEEKFSGAQNYKVAIHEGEKGIHFLHKIVPGRSERSYGIHVAQLAGLPSSVVKRASQLLTELEKGGPAPAVAAPAPSIPQQMELFPRSAPHSEELVVQELKKVDLTAITPLEALNQLATWQKKIR